MADGLLSHIILSILFIHVKNLFLRRLRVKFDANPAFTCAVSRARSRKTKAQCFGPTLAVAVKEAL